MIKTLVIKQKQLNQKQNLELIAKTIKANKLVIFPTETVYGIGANGLSSKATKAIYKAKGRPSDNPLILHILNKRELNKYTTNQSEAAMKLISKFWPGPLTLIFNKTKLVPKTTTGGLETVAIRMPSSKVAQQIIKVAGVPLAAPSANLSGKPTSTKFKHVYQDFNNKVNIIIDGGDSLIGLESTVVDTTVNPPVILRPGYVTKSMIEKTLGYKVEDKSLQTNSTKVKSPGLKYKHYQPQGKLFIIEGSINKMAKFVNTKAKQTKQKIAVICETEYAKMFDVKVRAIGSYKNQKLMSKSLFAALRDMDEWGIEIIYVHHLGNKDLAYSMMNRLYKAAEYKIIKV